MTDKNFGSVILAILRSMALSISILLGTITGYRGSYSIFSGLRSASQLGPWIDHTFKLSILLTLLTILGLLGLLGFLVRKNALVLREAFFEFQRYPTLTLRQMLSVFSLMMLVGATIYLSLAVYVRLLFML